MRRLVLCAALCIVTLPAALPAQSPEALIAAGDSLARASQHEEAIAAYRRALESTPDRRELLRARLGRQNLWAGHVKRGVTLLRAYLTDQDDCAVRLDLALGLAWDDDLAASNEEYRRVAEQCPGLRAEALLGQARNLRWDNRPSSARAIYQRALAEGSAAQRLQARIGLGFTLLAEDRPRAAADSFAVLRREEDGAAAVLEGAARAMLQMGLPSRARALLDQEGDLGSGLTELREEIDLLHAPMVSGAANTFRESDGTALVGYEVRTKFPHGRDGEVTLGLGRTRLHRGAVADERLRGSIEVSVRLSPAVALRAATAYHGAPPIAEDVRTGEAHLAWTPSDFDRLDVSLGRISLFDNLAAASSGLTGAYFSLGADRRIGVRTTLSASADVTHWSTGNDRLRTRLSLRQRLEGTPQIEVGASALLQHYNEPFDFALWSPDRYIETGLHADAYGRIGQSTYWSTRLLGGGQRESGSPWHPLGGAHASLEQIVAGRWSAVLEGVWSNSNISGNTGYERRSLRIGLSRRL